MRFLRIRHLCAAAARKWSRLFQAQVLPGPCISLLHGNGVKLAGSYIQGASAVLIRLTIQWPNFSLHGPQPVHTRILSAEGKPLFEPHQYYLRQYTHGHLTRLRIRFPTNSAIRRGQEVIRVEIRSSARQKLLGTLDYHPADLKQRPRNKVHRRKIKVVLRSLRLNAVRLFVQREAKRVETNILFETDPALSIAFRMECSGFDAEVSLVPCRLRIELLHLDSGVIIADHRNLLIQSQTNAPARIDIPLRRKHHTPLVGRYQLRLFQGYRLLATLEFRRLASSEIEPFTRQLVLESLRAENQRLWVQCGAIRYSSELVARSSDHLLPEFTLQATGFNSYLPSLKTLLAVSLTTSQARHPLFQIPINLLPQPIPVRLPPLSLHDLSPLAGSALCRLVASVGDKDFAAFPFRLLEESELVQQVSVSNLQVNAETSHALCASQVKRLRFGLHQAFWVSLEIVTDTLAPNISFPASIGVWQGASPCYSGHFELRLDRSTQQFVFPKVNMAALDHDKHAPQELRVEVSINGQPKRTHTLSLLPAQKITNFEGQLAIDPGDVDVEEGEYEQILHGLGTTKPSSKSRWRFWRKRS